MRTYAARFTLPDAPEWARLGMTATIHVGGEAAPPSARIPLSALHDRGRGPMVWRLADQGGIEAAPVTVLGLSESMATIRTNLPEGTRIVAMGAQLLAPDSRVRPVEARLAGSMR
jgi:multidrug efflux pump subunit AcrA (membrane-fusion protein)